MWNNMESIRTAKSIVMNKMLGTSVQNNSKSVAFKTVLESSEKIGFNSNSQRRNLRNPKFKNSSNDISPWLCWSCGRDLKYKCLLFKHQLYCIPLNKRKKSNQVFLRKRLELNKKVINGKKGKFNEASDSSISVESKKSASCACCGEKFFSPKQYLSHLQQGRCRKAQQFACTECKEKFDDSSKVQIHQRHCKGRFQPAHDIASINLQENTKHFSCRCCDSTFGFPELLKTHLLRNRMCAKVHHLSIKVEYLRKRGSTKSLTARKSFPSTPVTSTPSVLPTVKRYGSCRKSFPKAHGMNVTMPLSPVGGSARKTFHKTSGLPEEHVCPICGVGFSSLLKLQLHKKCHLKNSQMMSKCPECREIFVNSQQLLQHQAEFDHYGRAAKSLMSTCVCPFCSKKFLHVQTRNAHLRVHADRTSAEIKEFVNKTTCDICFRYFGSIVLKLQHVRLAHPELANDFSAAESPDDSQNSFDQLIGGPYVGNSKLKVMEKVPDVILKQLKKSPNVCPVCLKKFDSNFARNRHFRLHVLDGAYKCEFCETKFPRANRLAFHIQTVHKEFLKYECKECGSLFPSRLTVLQHVTKEHAESITNEMIQEQQTSREAIEEEECFKEEFYCDVCKLNFLKLCGLRRHQMSKLHNELLEAQKAANLKNLDLQFQFPPRAITPPIVDYSKLFTCSECAQEFDNVHDFIPHRLSHFSKYNDSAQANEVHSYTCEVCGKLMDNHQKIQLHLFWHLQDVQSQTGDDESIKIKTSKSTASSTKISTPTIPQELLGQAVAKKTFRTSGKQELIIGGIKKPLFTCKDCTIGFTTKRHYLLHMRQYCRARQVAKTDSLGNEDQKIRNGKVTIHCSKCDRSFEGRKAVVAHEKICVSETGTRYCAMCGCLFSSTALYDEHRVSFCTLEFVPHVDDRIINRNVKELKNSMKMDLNIVACVQCNVMFSSILMLSQHMKTHKTTATSKKKSAVRDMMHQKKIDLDQEVYDIPSDVNEDDDNNSLHFGELTENEPSLDEELQENSDQQSGTAGKQNTISNSDFSATENTQDSNSMSSEEGEADMFKDSHPEGSDSEITELRHNFSRLLNAIVSDVDLMQSLGYGKRLIDDVLVSVLKKMSLTPVANDSLPELDKLRTNIRTLLDVCIKDQIMEFIANRETTTDEIVVSALKIFGVDVDQVVENVKV